ncbi:MAG: HAD hydrolase family protein [Ignavibacteriota bacterium]
MWNLTCSRKPYALCRACHGLRRHLAQDGVVSDSTLESLKRLRKTGRKIILVTGRELPDLESVFPHFELFDRIVAENGALLYNPATKETRLLASAPSPQLIDRLRAANLPNERRPRHHRALAAAGNRRHPGHPRPRT